MHTFPKTCRLLKSKEFQRVGRHGSFISGKLLNIRMLKSSNLKIGLTVSKKFGKAHQRNRFKRLVREVFRLSKLELGSNIHICVYPKKEAQSATFDTLKNEFIYLVTAGSV